MKCYRFGDVDTVVAADPADAWVVLEAHSGDASEYRRAGVEPDELADSEMLTIHEFDYGDGSRTQTYGEWAAENGRGFLCSTEW
jgi:hypothetical protein